MTLSVRFWGVRGSIACCGPRTARYGGNTSALEVRCGSRLLMFDARTRIRSLGQKLAGAGALAPDPCSPPAATLAAGADVVLRPAPLNHPDGAVGYRVEYGGRSVCYVTDTEHVPGA